MINQDFHFVKPQFPEGTIIFSTLEIDWKIFTRLFR